MQARRNSNALASVVALIIAGAAMWGAFSLLRFMWSQLFGLNVDLAVGILTACTTILVAALTVAFGRYFERKKEIESHFREKKVAIYDKFLEEFFSAFHEPNKERKKERLTAFLREWQRKTIVWGGAEVLVAYILWMRKLQSGEPDADGLFLMEDLFLKMRKDLGLSNNGLARGMLVGLVLRNPELFMSMVKENPAVTLSALAKRERELGLE